jgi:predicted phosphodiesterase
MNTIIENDKVFDYLFVGGDTHGNNKQLASHLLPNLPKESKKAILHVGDFGMGFSSHVGELENMQILDRKLQKQNVWLYVIRGNHDNPSYFETGNLIHEDMESLSNIMLIPDHSMLHLQTIDNNNLSIYCLGGAVSVDRVNRTPSKSYWWNEMVPDLPQQELDKIPKGIDIVLTHTRPQGIFPIDKNGIEHWLLRDRGLDYDLGVELGRITKVFDAINKKNTCYTHYYGHFHMSNTEHFGDIKHQLLNIDELIEVRLKQKLNEDE